MVSAPLRQRPVSVWAWPLLASLVLLPTATSLPAQQVDVQLREEGSRAPVIGAIVRLLPEAADLPVHAQALSDIGGRVRLAAPGAGRYRLRVDRIGWAGIISASFTLDSGQVLATELVLADLRLELPTVTVQARSVCGPQFTGDLATARLWEEIAKALTAQVISTEAGALPLRLREFRRELDTRGRVVREWNTAASTVYGKVYETLPPALLAREGFILQDNLADETIYAVPDAELLTSGEFILTHCFRGVEGEGGLIGLEFEPVPRRPVADVAGTLWLDAASGELKHLEFRYTGVPAVHGRMEIGGRVDFARLPTGEWIVSHWVTRTPWIAIEERRSGGGLYRSVERFHGYLELGGRVDVATDLAADLSLAGVRGQVLDSLSGAGLGGAVVTVADLGAVETDATGEFRIAVSANGPQELVVSHPILNLPAGPVRVPVVLSVGDDIEVSIGSASLPTLVRAACGNVRNRSGLVGVVMDARGGVVTAVDVRARWSDARGGYREQRARMGAHGLFGLCDLPGDAIIELFIQGPDGPVARQRADVPFREFGWEVLRIP